MTESIASSPETPAFAVSVSEAGSGKSVVAAEGELDIASSPRLLSAVAVLGRPGTNAIAIDRHVHRLERNQRAPDSRPLGQCPRRRRDLAAPSERVQKVLELVRLGDILPLETTLPTAFARLEEDGSIGPSGR